MRYLTVLSFALGEHKVLRMPQRLYVRERCTGSGWESNHLAFTQ